MPSCSSVTLRATIAITCLLSPSLHANHDLADLAVRLHELDGLAQTAEVEDRVDDRVDLAGLEVGDDVPHEPAHGLRALSGGAEPVAHAEHGQPVAVQRLQVDG